jgi:hypothetical protein
MGLKPSKRMRAIGRKTKKLIERRARDPEFRAGA